MLKFRRNSGEELIKWGIDMAIQLDLFEDNEKVLILDELKRMKTSNESVRKKCFAKIGEFQKDIQTWKIEVFEKLLVDLREEINKVKNG